MDRAKPFCISKHIVWTAYKLVKANKGAAGVDGESLEEFEVDLKNNLYKIWNRMSSGSYMPPPVRVVAIPKEGGQRKLGIPTVSDRIAQMVVKLHFEPGVEPYFHPDSYGYRPRKSAIDAVGVTRRRCWRYDWVLDLDIKGFFDNIDHELMMRAVRKHTNSKWVILYIERWLKAPAELPGGTLAEREKGTPQGGVISPLIANLFLHYALDEWMRRNYPSIPFERYADDVTLHCRTRKQARFLHWNLEKRMAECGLELHPDKTRIVYCKDANRKGQNDKVSFDFLGFTFRPRLSRNRIGRYFVNFSPAISKKAIKRINLTSRQWKLHLRSGSDLERLAELINPVVRGWINYYGKFYRSALYPIFWRLNRRLAKWAMRKYKRLRGHELRANHWLGQIALREPSLFAHWQFGVRPSAGQ